MSINEVIQKLSKPVDSQYLATREQRTKGGGSIQLTYIPWHFAAKILNEVAPGWEGAVVDVKQIGNLVVATYSMTIEGVTRQNTGIEDINCDSYGDPVSNAISMALRRCAALFGLALHLYDKTNGNGSNGSGYKVHEGDPYASSRGPVLTGRQDTDEGTPFTLGAVQPQVQPTLPAAPTWGKNAPGANDAPTDKQFNAIRAICNSLKLNPDVEAFEGYKADGLDKLNRRQASEMIDNLKKRSMAQSASGR